MGNLGDRKRNPWDKVVSLYFWLNKTEPRPLISDFIKSGGANKVKGFDLYTQSSDIIVDKVFFYESLEESMTEIGKRLGIGETPHLPLAKTDYRKDKSSYRDILSEEDRDKITKVFAREIAYFNYKW